MRALGQSAAIPGRSALSQNHNASVVKRLFALLLFALFSWSGLRAGIVEDVSPQRGRIGETD